MASPYDATGARGGMASSGPTPAIAKKRANAAFKKRNKKTGPGTTPGGFMFPSSDISPQEMAAVLASSRRQVGQIYGAAPLPDLTTYQQPFIDAATHEAKLGNDMLAAIGASATNAQGMTTGLSDWIMRNVQGTQADTAAALGPGAPQVAPYTNPGATALTTASLGTSQAQYLNALAPYVAGSGQQYLRDITRQRDVALKDYNQQVQERSANQIKDIQDLYSTNLKSMQDTRRNVTRDAIAEYIALTNAGMKAKDAAEKVRKDTADILKGIRANEIAQQNADAHTTSAGASAYKATHPAAAGRSPTSIANNKTQAWKDFLKIWGAPRPTSDVGSYDHAVQITYLNPGTSLLPKPHYVTFTQHFTSLDQAPGNKGVQDQVKQWIHDHRAQFPSATFSATQAGKAITTPDLNRRTGPGDASIWQQAINAYAAHFQPKPGETEAQFRKRMVAAVSVRYPRPKGA